MTLAETIVLFPPAFPNRPTDRTRPFVVGPFDETITILSRLLLLLLPTPLLLLLLLLLILESDRFLTLPNVVAIVVAISIALLSIHSRALPLIYLKDLIMKENIEFKSSSRSLIYHRVLNFLIGTFRLNTFLYLTPPFVAENQYSQNKKRVNLLESERKTIRTRIRVCVPIKIDWKYFRLVKIKEERRKKNDKCKITCALLRMWALKIDMYSISRFIYIQTHWPHYCCYLCMCVYLVPS